MRGDAGDAASCRGAARRRGSGCGRAPRSCWLGRSVSTSAAALAPSTAASAGRGVERDDRGRDRRPGSARSRMSAIVADGEVADLAFAGHEAHVSESARRHRGRVAGGDSGARSTRGDRGVSTRPPTGATSQRLVRPAGRGAARPGRPGVVRAARARASPRRRGRAGRARSRAVATPPRRRGGAVGQRVAGAPASAAPAPRRPPCPRRRGARVDQHVLDAAVERRRRRSLDPPASSIASTLTECGNGTSSGEHQDGDRGR